MAVVLGIVLVVGLFVRQQRFEKRRLQILDEHRGDHLLFAIIRPPGKATLHYLNGRLGPVIEGGARVRIDRARYQLPEPSWAQLDLPRICALEGIGVWSIDSIWATDGAQLL
jgi:hypothetical protein